VLLGVDIKKKLYLCTSKCGLCRLHPDRSMCGLESLKIDLNGLTESETVLGFDLDDSFFEAVNAPDVRKGEVHVSLSIRKTGDLFEFLFHIEGSVTVQCDLCLDDMLQSVVADDKLTVKLGPEYSEDNDLVIVEENEGVFDISWFVYEMIALAVPIKHVHAPGKCDRAMTERLKEFSDAVRSSENEHDEVDPRWSALLKLKE